VKVDTISIPALKIVQNTIFVGPKSPVIDMALRNAWSGAEAGMPVIADLHCRDDKNAKHFRSKDIEGLTEKEISDMFCFIDHIENKGSLIFLVRNKSLSYGSMLFKSFDLDVGDEYKIMSFFDVDRTGLMVFDPVCVSVSKRGVCHCEIGSGYDLTFDEEPMEVAIHEKNIIMQTVGVALGCLLSGSVDFVHEAIPPISRA
jgi:hypothetical protein